MIKPLKLLTVATLSALTVACVSVPATPKSFNQLGQFQHIALNANTYRIQFKTNGQLSYGHAEEIALVKSAQFTLEQGYAFFKVLDDPSNRLNQQAPRQTVVYPSRSMFDGYYYHPRYRNHPLFWHDPIFDTPYVVELEPNEVSYTIQLLTPEQATGDAFEAKLILQSLGEKYQLNPDGSPKIIQPSQPVK